MKIRNMLLIGPVFVIILILVFSSVVYVSFNRVAEENERESIAQEIHQTVSELDIIMYEYLTHREERMMQQWNLKYNATREIIEKAEIVEEEWKATKSNYADLKDLFSKVTANYKKQGSSELEERLVAQFLIKSHSIISGSSAIAKEAYNDAIEAQETANNSMSIVLVVIFVVLVGVSFHIRRLITKPLEKLTKGTKIIGKGNLKHRIDIKTKDELGVLASAFNQMTSDLKKSRDEIEEYSKNLEKQVAERTKELKVLNKDLERKVRERTAEVEKLLKQKDEFINQLSHDLKSPLNPIVNLLPGVMENIDDPELKEDLEIISRNVDYIKTLTLDTLMLARLNSSSIHLDLKNLNLLKLADSVVKNNKSFFEEKGIQVENKIGDNLFVNGDELRLKEVFNNLSSNAVTSMGQGGTLTFNAEKTQNEDFIIISVKDTGIGMTQDQISKIFDEFFKGDPSRHNMKSSGLGLSICKKIVEKHGGLIWAESNGVNKGSTMFFTIPLSSK